MLKKYSVRRRNIKRSNRKGDDLPRRKRKRETLHVSCHAGRKVDCNPVGVLRESSSLAETNDLPERRGGGGEGNVA